MLCRHCGTEIAEKALICFRCGAATTDAKFQPPAPGRARSRPWPRLLAIVLVILLVGLLAAYVGRC